MIIANFLGVCVCACSCVRVKEVDIGETSGWLFSYKVGQLS